MTKYKLKRKVTQKTKWERLNGTGVSHISAIFINTVALSDKTPIGCALLAQQSTRLLEERRRNNSLNLLLCSVPVSQPCLQMLANSSRKTFRKGNSCAAEHEPHPASAALTGCKRVRVSQLRVDLGATHGDPLEVWPEERLCPGGRWRQHFGQWGGLLLRVQPGGFAVCRSWVLPHGGAVDQTNPIRERRA